MNFKFNAEHTFFALRQKDMTKEDLVKMVKETMTKEELLSLLLGK